jgi:hypothetical protein
MVETISIEVLAEKLKDIFCAENKTSKKYSEIWLSDVDFGGLYQTDKVVVNVRAEHEIDSCNEEIKYIVTVLFKQLSKEELSFIWRVDVYNSFEEIHCQSDDFLVYTTLDPCP